MAQTLAMTQQNQFGSRGTQARLERAARKQGTRTNALGPAGAPRDEQLQAALALECIHDLLRAAPGAIDLHNPVAALDRLVGVRHVPILEQAGVDLGDDEAACAAQVAFEAQGGVGLFLQDHSPLLDLVLRCGLVSGGLRAGGLLGRGLLGGAGPGAGHLHLDRKRGLDALAGVLELQVALEALPEVVLGQRRAPEDVVGLAEVLVHDGEG
mmetsp:Transcript_58927/g.115908  ORF Transcript_58927/g.115908 Transcript_58927/m.115908 type:complete len:211 (-) Transcript_58927:754-1386(-)